MDKKLIELIEYYEQSIIKKESEVTKLYELRHKNNFMHCTAKYVNKINKLLIEIDRHYLKLNQLRLKYWYWK